jgi:hypothetical protein
MVKWDDEIPESELAFMDGNWGSDVEMFWKYNNILDHKVKGTIPDLRRDDGQNPPVFVDKVAGAVEDVQNARVARIFQPIVYSGRERKGIYGVH